MMMGRDGGVDDDLEALMAALTPEELGLIVDDMVSDPDDKHVPASLRNSYRCSKEPTGELNRDSLINHINQEGANAPDKVHSLGNIRTEQTNPKSPLIIN